MAKFHGFEIKSMKTFEGHEGPCSQGNVYLNGKKLGFWSNDSWGGEDHFSFSTRELDRLVAEQVPECSIDCGDTVIPADTSMVLAHLSDMKETEKAWKKEDKKGRALVVMTPESYSYSVMYGIRKDADTKRLLQTAKQTAAQVAKEDGIKVGYKLDVYHDASCFVVGKPLANATDAVKAIQAENARREEIMRGIGNR